MDDQVHRAPRRRPKDAAPDPEVAEGGSVRGREVVEDGGRDPARGGNDSSYTKDNLVRRAEWAALELVQLMDPGLARGAELESNAES